VFLAPPPTQNPDTQLNIPLRPSKDVSVVLMVKALVGRVGVGRRERERMVGGECV
jgi:hypothetical protein